MPVETPREVAENCTGTWRDYWPREAHDPDAAFMRCDGCGEVIMIRKGQKITLIPGK